MKKKNPFTIFYGDLKLQAKFTLIMFLAVTIPMVTMLTLIAGRASQMVTSDTIRKEQVAAAKTAPLLDNIISDITGAADEIEDTTFYNDFFKKSSFDNPYSALHSDAAGVFSEECSTLAEQHHVSAVRIYTDLPSSSPAFSDMSDDSVFRSMDSVRSTYWYGIFYSTHPSSLFCPSFYLSSKEKSEYGDCAYILPLSFHYPDGTYIRCYMVCYFSSQLLKDVITSHLSAEGSVSYICNDRDATITATDTSLAGIYYMNYDDIRSNLMSSNGFIEKNVLGEKVYVGYYSINKANWVLVSVLPSGPLQAKANLILCYFILLCIASIGASILISILLSRSISRRIIRVSRQMSQVKTHPPVPMSSPEETDEIGDLVDSYNYMARKINHLMDEQERSAEELRIAEFRSLQAQINPHFLYNTMEMINWMAQQGRIRETNHAIRDLSRFYKLTLSRKNPISTISEEIEHVSIYTRLQNMRFNDGIEFVVDVPDSILDFRIPRLTLQPVVENAILHGILEKPSHSGTIVITGWQEEDTVVLLISDDGVGIPEDKLGQILEDQSGTSSDDKGSHIAVYNTHKRLQILYGERYGLTYHSTPGKGTEVEIRIPADSSSVPPVIDNLGEGHSIPIISSDTDIFSVASNSAAMFVEHNLRMIQDTYQLQKLHHVSSRLPGGEKIYLFTHLVSEAFPEHHHDYCEANYVCSGTLKEIIDGREILLHAGDLIVMNKNALHAMDCSSPDNLILNICVDDAFLKGPLKNLYEQDSPLSSMIRGHGADGHNSIYYPLGHMANAQSLLASLLKVYSASGFHETAELDAVFLKFFEELAAAAEYSFYGPDEETLQILSCVSGDCFHLTLAEMAVKLKISEQYMQEHVTRCTGRRLKEIILETRMQKAKELISNVNQNLYAIAELCGYHSLSAFSHDFTKFFGTSPEEYRRQFL